MAAQVGATDLFSPIGANTPGLAPWRVLRHASIHRLPPPLSILTATASRKNAPPCKLYALLLYSRPPLIATLESPHTEPPAWLSSPVGLWGGRRFPPPASMFDLHLVGVVHWSMRFAGVAACSMGTAPRNRSRGHCVFLHACTGQPN